MLAVRTPEPEEADEHDRPTDERAQEDADQREHPGVAAGERARFVLVVGQSENDDVDGDEGKNAGGEPACQRTFRRRPALQQAVSASRLLLIVCVSQTFVPGMNGAAALQEAAGCQSPATPAGVKLPPVIFRQAAAVE